MNAARWAWILGAFYGMTGAMLGALGAHGLRGKLAARSLESFVTGTRYQMVHAMVLLAVAILLAKASSGWFKAAAGLLICGILLFSGSIYLLTLTKAPVGIITPIGGLLIISGWLCLMIGGFTHQGLSHSHTDPKA